MSEDGRTIGDVIDALGVAPTRHEGDLFTAAVVVLVAVEEDGSERLSIAWSDGLSWITRAGMLHQALAIDTTTSSRPPREGE